MYSILECQENGLLRRIQVSLKRPTHTLIPLKTKNTFYVFFYKLKYITNLCHNFYVNSALMLTWVNYTVLNIQFLVSNVKVCEHKTCCTLNVSLINA